MINKKAINLTVPTPNFDEFSIEKNGLKFWSGIWYSEILGYSSLQSLMPNIKKAESLSVRLGLRIEEHFLRENINKKHEVYLSKIACFLISLEADGRKPIVKRARSYFLNIFHEFDQLLTNEQYLERTEERQILKKLNTKLSKAARRAHVKDFQYFINEGYLGMYGLTVRELKEERQLSQKDNLYDHMSFEELTAHVFRISFVIKKLKGLRNPSEIIAAREHRKIALQINKIMSYSTGVAPKYFKNKSSLARLKKQLNVMNRSLAPANESHGNSKNLKIRTHI